MSDNIKNNNPFFHVVTEKPMYKGQVILCNEDNKNGVAKRVERVRFLMKRDENKITKPSDFDKLVYSNPDYWQGVYDREIALETIRKELYSQLPSRMACLYASADLQDAQKWAKYFMKVERKVFQIVQLSNIGGCFTGDANNCWGGKVSDGESREKAIRYWSNGQNTRNLEAIHETIIDGEIYVVEILENFV